MQVANRIGFKLRFFDPGPLQFWQAADTVALQAAVQRRAAQVGNSLLERIKAIIERQPGLLAKEHDSSLFGGREHGGSGLGAAHGFLRAGPLPPLGHRFHVDS